MPVANVEFTPRRPCYMSQCSEESIVRSSNRPVQLPSKVETNCLSFSNSLQVIVCPLTPSMRPGPYMARFNFEMVTCSCWLTSQTLSTSRKPCSVGYRTDSQIQNIDRIPRRKREKSCKVARNSVCLSRVFSRVHRDARVVFESETSDGSHRRRIRLSWNR